MALAWRRKNGIGKYVESTIFGDSLDNGKDGKGKGGAKDDFRKPSGMVEEKWCHNGKGSKIELVNSVRFQRKKMSKVKIKQHHLGSSVKRLQVIFAVKFQRSGRKVIMG